MFNLKGFDDELVQILDEHKNIENIVDNVVERKINRIYMIGCGGAYTKMYSAYNYMKKHLSIPVYVEDPSELCNCLLDTIDKHTLVIVGSKTGVTTEVIDACKIIRNKNALIVGFIGVDNTPLEELVDYRIHTVCTDVHILQLSLLAIDLCRKLEGYDGGYDTFLKILYNANDIVKEKCVKLLPSVKEYAKKINDNDFIMGVASSNLIGEMRCTTNYVLEEVDWIPSQTVHSGEFFHGPFELLDKNLAIILAMTDGDNRKQDERAKNFIEKFGEKYLIIDLADFKFEGMKQELKELINPWLLTTILYHFEDYIGDLKQRNHSTRRYYRKFEY